MTSAIAAATEEVVVKARANRVNPDQLIAELSGRLAGEGMASDLVARIQRMMIESAEKVKATQGESRSGWKLPVRNYLLPILQGITIPADAEQNVNVGLQIRDGKLIVDGDGNAALTIARPQVSGGPRVAKTTKSGQSVGEKFPDRNVPLGTHLFAIYNGVKHDATRVEGGYQLDGSVEVYKSLSSLGTAVTGGSVNGWSFWQVS